MIVYGLFDGCKDIGAYFFAADAMAAQKQVMAFLGNPFFTGSREYDTLFVKEIVEIGHVDENGCLDIIPRSENIGTVKEIMFNILGSHPIKGLTVAGGVDDAEDENV